MSIEPLSDVIMAIYESALAPDGWSGVLRQIVNISGSGACRIVIQSDLTGSLIYSIVDGVASQAIGPPLEANLDAAPSRERQLIPIGEPIIRSRMADKLAVTGSGQPWQVYGGERPFDVLTVVLVNSGTDRIILEAVKTEPQDSYTDLEFERMRLVGPHVCRAVRISESLNGSRQTSAMLEASLEALSTGVYFLGRGNRVVYLNRVARAQVRSGKVLRLVDDRLVATDRGAQKQLLSELHDIGSGLDREDRPGAAIALADGEGAGYVAHVLPLRGGAQSHLAYRFAAVVAIFVQDPATAPSPANAAFAKLYGLTEGELRLLNGLMPGLSLAETAQLLGISEATAKTHLRRIFAKTKTSKQAELLYLLMTSTPPTIAR